MKPEERSDRLHDEAMLRQRNLVYPDTIRNESEGYRHLLSTRRMSPVERSGSFIIGVLFAALGIAITFASFVLPRIAGTGSDSRIFGVAMIPFALVMTGVGVVIAALGIRLLKRALRP
jgi:hypothetical protein